MRAPTASATGSTSSFAGTRAAWPPRRSPSRHSSASSFSTRCASPPRATRPSRRQRAPSGSRGSCSTCSRAATRRQARPRAFGWSRWWTAACRRRAASSASRRAGRAPRHAGRHLPAARRPRPGRFAAERRARAAASALHGTDHPDVAESDVALGLLRSDQARFDDAEQLVRQGLTQEPRPARPGPPRRGEGDRGARTCAGGARRIRLGGAGAGGGGADLLGTGRRDAGALEQPVRTGQHALLPGTLGDRRLAHASGAGDEPHPARRPASLRRGGPHQPGRHPVRGRPLCRGGALLSRGAGHQQRLVRPGQLRHGVHPDDAGPGPGAGGEVRRGDQHAAAGARHPGARFRAGASPGRFGGE